MGLTLGGNGFTWCPGSTWLASSMSSTRCVGTTWLTWSQNSGPDTARGVLVRTTSKFELCNARLCMCWLAGFERAAVQRNPRKNARFEVWCLLFIVFFVNCSHKILHVSNSYAANAPTNKQPNPISHVIRISPRKFRKEWFIKGWCQTKSLFSTPPFTWVVIGHSNGCSTFVLPFWPVTPKNRERKSKVQTHDWEHNMTMVCNTLCAQPRAHYPRICFTRCCRYTASCSFPYPSFCGLCGKAKISRFGLFF